MFHYVRKDGKIYCVKEGKHQPSEAEKKKAEKKSKKK